MKRYSRLYESVSLSNEIIKLADELKSRFPQADWFEGDCAVFSLYLKKYFNRGDVVAIYTEDEPDRILHTVWMDTDFKEYDARGHIYTDDLINEFYAPNYSEDSVTTTPMSDQDELLSKTDPNLTPEQIKEIL